VPVVSGVQCSSGIFESPCGNKRHRNSDITTPQATATKAGAYFKAFAPGLVLVRLIPSVLGAVLRTILVSLARGLPDAKWFELFLAVCFVRAMLRRDLQVNQGGSRRYGRLNEYG